MAWVNGHAHTYWQEIPLGGHFGEHFSSLLEFKMCIPYDPSVPFLRISQWKTWPYANGQYPRKLSGLCLVETFNSQSAGSKEVKCGIISSGARRQRQAIPGSRRRTKLRATPPACTHHVCANKHTHKKNKMYFTGHRKTFWVNSKSLRTTTSEWGKGPEEEVREVSRNLFICNAVILFKRKYIHVLLV